MHTNTQPVLIVKPRNKPSGEAPVSCHQSYYGQMLLEYMLFTHNTEQLGQLMAETEKLRE
jgi:hypothetical protein